MSAMKPWAELIGKADIYVAPYGEAEPAIDAAVGGNWVLLGATDGDQTIKFAGAHTFFRDNDHTGPVSARRPEEDVMVEFTIVHSTLENIARVMHNVSHITTTTSGAAAVKKMGFRRGQVPTEYALLMRGETDSPYGLYRGQNYIPRCISDAEPELTRGKDTRAEIACSFVALEDDAVSEDYRLGWSTVQTS
jgi:hypothetical protein